MKRLLLILFSVVSIVSCNSDSSDVEKDSIPLRFDTSGAAWTKETKGDYTGNSGANPIPDMVVYGYYTNNDNWFDVRNTAYPLFMNEVIVTNTSGVWAYSPLRYFFPEGKHSFFAFAPYNSVVSDNRNSFSIPDNKGIPVLSYALSDEIAGHKDLLFGWKNDVEQSTQGSSPIEINFVHTTTKITFSARLADDYIIHPNKTVRIKSITLSNIYTKGQARVQYNTTSGSEGISGMEWINQSDLQSIYLNITSQTLLNVGLTKTMTSISPSATALYMIPQNIASRGSEIGSPTLSLQAEVTNNITNTSETKTESFDMTLMEPKWQIWQPGSSLNFQISYSGDGSLISLILVDPGTGNPNDLGEPIGH